MIKRSFVEEITEVRGRLLYKSHLGEVELRIRELEQQFSRHPNLETELLRYFPVALIACLEGFFRIAVAHITDSGEPYSSNADRLYEKRKLDLQALHALQGKRVSIGELIAHSISISSLDHIEFAMSELLGVKSFLSELQEVNDRYSELEGGKTPILETPDAIYSDVRRTFELRHIICHEIASGFIFRRDEIVSCFTSCVTFLKAAEAYVSEVLYPNAPLSQTRMNVEASKDLSETRDRLEAVYSSIKESITDEEKMRFLESSQEKWKEYSEAWAMFESDYHEGGSIRPTLYFSFLRALVESRTLELESYYQNQEDFKKIMDILFEKMREASAKQGGIHEE